MELSPKEEFSLKRKNDVRRGSSEFIKILFIFRGFLECYNAEKMGIQQKEKVL